MAEICQVQDGGVRSDAPVMIRVIRICRNCGAKIFSDAPEGLCTGCVLEAAVLPTDDERSSANKDNANAPTENKKTARAIDLLGSTSDSRLIPSGVISNAHEEIRLIGKPMIKKSTTSRTAQFGVPKNRNTCVAI